MRARYFNNIIKKDNIVTKSSTDIYKIKSEFKYYYLLPEELRKFYVKPYNYRENENEALYDMDYAGITLFEFLNTSIIHTDGETFNKAIDLIIKQLKEYFILKSKYNKIVSNDNFILNKVLNRVDKLKKLPEYRNLNLFLNMTNTDLDELVNSFKDDYNNICELNITKTISHGDLHFSNILINEETFEIKFIDVRGAMHEDDLYIDQYYDYAKLAKVDVLIIAYGSLCIFQENEDKQAFLDKFAGIPYVLLEDVTDDPRGIYVIVPAMNPKNILDIIPAKELEKDWYEERQDLLVVGVAKGYDEALEVAGQIVGRLYRTTGSFELERML